MDLTSASEPVRELPAEAPPKPVWVDRYFGPDAAWCGEHRNVPRDLGADAFQALVQDAYESVFDRLAARRSVQPIRFWAFIPSIHADVGSGMDRYMVFNGGRLAAYNARLGTAMVSKGLLPTASATGVSGNRFFLHCLASSASPAQIENPRQVPAYRYSVKYGPVPPAFARSAIVEAPSGQRLLLVAGTASIMGEDSQHYDALGHQIGETLLNLATLIHAARGAVAPDHRDGIRLALRDFEDIRIYHPRLSDRAAIMSAVSENFSPRCRVEILQAQLCRSELLFEIEGVASAGHHQR